MRAHVLQVCKLSYNREGFSEVEPCIMLLHVNFLLFYFFPLLVHDLHWNFSGFHVLITEDPPSSYWHSWTLLLSCIQKMPPVELQWLLMRSKLPYKKMSVEISMQASIFTCDQHYSSKHLILYWFVSVKSFQLFIFFVVEFSLL